MRQKQLQRFQIMILVEAGKITLTDIPEGLIGFYIAGLQKYFLKFG